MTHKLELSNKFKAAIIELQQAIVNTLETNEDFTKEKKGTKRFGTKDQKSKILKVTG